MITKTNDTEYWRGCGEGEHSFTADGIAHYGRHWLFYSITYSIEAGGWFENNTAQTIADTMYQTSYRRVIH